MSDYADFRSDTVTQPTPAMRDAMARAVVGDDVYGDDPTVLRLEAEAARVTGKEAALFVVSGTMGNQLAIAAQTRRGDEIIVPERCHIVVHEAGAAAYLSGVQVRCLPAGPGKLPSADAVDRTIRKDPSNIHSPRTALISYENADSDGFVHPLTVMDGIAELARAHRIPVHLDGARLFNAARHLGTAARELADRADTVMFCLSKGLSVPVGSMLCGPGQVIDAARRIRKQLGGGWRQAGVLAAAGLVALDSMVERLDEDHARARDLAERIRRIPGLEPVRPASDINMVFFRLTDFPADAATVVANMAQEHILVNPPEDGVFRVVTHAGITDAHADALIGVLQALSGR